VFDKTGTVTTGRLAVNRLGPALDVKPAELLRYAACAEKFSTHPAAKSAATTGRGGGVAGAGSGGLRRDGPAAVSGRGWTGGRCWWGRATWLRTCGVPEGFESSSDLRETDGYSLVFVAVEGRCAGWVSFQGPGEGGGEGGDRGSEGSRYSFGGVGVRRPDGGGRNGWRRRLGWIGWRPSVCRRTRSPLFVRREPRVIGSRWLAMG
jgi:hypothetical protein